MLIGCLGWLGELAVAEPELPAAEAEGGAGREASWKDEVLEKRKESKRARRWVSG